MLHLTLSPTRAFCGTADRNRGYGFRAHRGACHRAALRADPSAPSGRAVLVCLTGKSPIGLSSPVSKNVCVQPIPSAHEAAGATGIRRSPRPLWAENSSNASGASRREGVNVRLAVIASAAKQSILSLRGAMDCFASLAMTARAMDCFAEPVIGRAFARPVRSQ